MKALILLSGGIDSTVILAMALQKKRECCALSFHYGQRHAIELKSAQAIAKHYNIPFRIIHISLNVFDGSSLVNDLPVPKYKGIEDAAARGCENTYVPARNTLFLAYALGQAEIWEADEIYVGPNAHDHPTYPDCSPQYYETFQHLAQLATRKAMDGKTPQICTPLIHMSKVEIVRKGNALGAPLELTHSCYDPLSNGTPCNQCLPCVLRNDAFHQCKEATTTNNLKR